MKAKQLWYHISCCLQLNDILLRVFGNIAKYFFNYNPFNMEIKKDIYPYPWFMSVYNKEQNGIL